jgi:hypothetical protein
LKLKYDKPWSSFAFDVKLRPCIKGPIHCDAEDALLMQFDGSKTVYLADPGYFKALDVRKGSYARRAYHNVAVSDVDFW